MIINVSGFYSLDTQDSWNQLTLGSIYLECDTRTGPVNILLPALRRIDGHRPFFIYVSDVYGNALANNITITCSGGNTINGGHDATIDTNKGAASVCVVSVTQWLANISSSVIRGTTG